MSVKVTTLLCALLAPTALAHAGSPAAAEGKAIKPNLKPAVLANPGAAALVPKLELKKWTLPNGLEVLLLEDHKAPLVSVQVWYHVGSKDEPRGMRGIAHMFEHLRFKGSKRVPPEEYTKLIDRIGGESNAFTTEDVTAFFQSVPKAYLGFALELESERMRNLLLTPATVNSEREVVKEEKRQRLDNDPLARAFERFRQIAFTRHPYGWTPAGDLAELDQVSVEACQRFYDTYYIPNNAALLVVGDTDEATLRPLVDKMFGAIERGKDPIRPAKITPEPEQTQAREEIVSWPSQIGLVIAGWHAPPAVSADSFVLEVMAAILSSGDSSRLNMALTRGKAPVAVQAGGSLMTQEDPGLIVTYGVFQTGEADKVKAALLGEIKKLQTAKVSARELSKAKNQLVASYIYGLQRVEGVATQLGSFHYLYGDAARFLTAARDIDAITADDVQRVAKKYLIDANMTVVVVKPKAPEKAKTPAESAKDKLQKTPAPGTTPAPAPAPTPAPATAPPATAPAPTAPAPAPAPTTPAPTAPKGGN